jgi:hypothetical protein
MSTIFCLKRVPVDKGGNLFGKVDGFFFGFPWGAFLMLSFWVVL